MATPVPDDLATRVAAWIDGDPDPTTRAELSASSADDLAERFADTLRFGTAGLRGPVRAGPGGMNVAVVIRTTAALAAWLHRSVDGTDGARTVVVGHDARTGSVEFATAAGEVLAGAGFDVVALPGHSPTPLVAHACRALDAVAAVQITASHNPPADNGYKVYLRGGAQLIPPADREIEELIADVGPANRVRRTQVASDDRGTAASAAYLRRLRERFGGPDGPDVRIALTALHGVGGPLALAALVGAGITDVHVVPEQFDPDPAFPTVRFPNPEEPGAADRVLALAEDVGADLAIALDPDADRCAIGVRRNGLWQMLTGDETGALVGAHLLADGFSGDAGATARAGDERPVVASTIVSGSLLAAVAAAADARHVRTLTGFKWLVRAGEPLRYAYEEAIGHCVDPDAVRDKDGISAAVVAARIAQLHRRAGTTVDDGLDELFRRHGVHVTTQQSIRVTDLSVIGRLMSTLRTDPPHSLAGITVVAEDLAVRTDALRTDAVEFTGRSDDGVALRVIARPSGTEPKLKYYVEVIAPPEVADIATTRAELTDLAARVAADLPADAG
ncbi:phospho-sugar mutase [Gordonia soli]|uniref:Putative phosphoglucomutase n=1 Tax=Gordonia soli NBRC 108243 TaxID=1223545 RepID=M0QNF3_9ACTN|nr:phospho-sugar mutase [Gordonia soli]GAC69811.1 putative phosphoglucomutase [Gordonia soli NBRC 108243]